MARSGSLQTHWLFNTFSSIDHSGNGFKNDRQLILNLFDFDDWILAVYSFWPLVYSMPGKKAF